ncbi:MAG TPA: hemolysin family protein [Solirubrobacteraceae bacterium]
MTALALVITGLLIALNAFFVAAEYALVRSRRSRLEALKDEGARGAELALQEVDDIGDYISAVQVGITMTSIGIGALGEPVLADLLEGLFGKPLSHGVSIVISVTVAYLLITSAHIVAGELVPKLYVIDKAEGVARRLARPLRFFRILFHPFIVVLTAISYRILRWLGVDPEKVAEEGGTPEELKALIAESYTGGKLDPGEAGMLTGVFHLHEQEARQVMTPIPAVVTVDISEDVETALRRCISSGHTRLLVTEDENQDRVRGTVHVSSLARQLMAEGPHAAIDGLVKDAVIVPETKPLDDLRADLQRARSSRAVVIDEYGRVAGIVAVEDIVEEVVGEIDDETDPAGGEIRRLANGDWFVRGHVAVTDLLDYGLELPVDTDAYNSVGGFVFAELGRLPKRGDTVTADGYSIRVESVRENRIEAVRIRDRGSATATG